MSEESEFGKGFADDHDDWGMNVNPEKLNTLKCLNDHLYAEEDCAAQQHGEFFVVGYLVEEERHRFSPSNPSRPLTSYPY